MAIELILNTTRGQLIENFSSSPRVVTAEGLLQAHRANKMVVDLIAVEETGLLDPAFAPITWSDQALDIAIVRPAQPVRSGAWKLTYGGDSTPVLPTSTTSTQPLDVDLYLGTIEDIINDLASIVSAGGVTIRKHDRDIPEGNAFEIHFTEAGVRTAFTAADLGLNPVGEVAFDTLVTGDSSKAHVELVTIFESALVHTANAGFTNPAGTALSATETVAGDGSTAEIQTLELTPKPIGGKWKPIIEGTTLGFIPHDATRSEFQTACDNASVAVTVQKLASHKWLIIWTATGVQTAITADITSLVVAVRHRATLDFDTPQLRQVFSGRRGPVPAVFSVLLTADDASETRTVYSEDFLITREMINSQTTS